jgi:hypothetical protein
MIALETIPVQLKINSNGSVNTGRYFNQNDNGVGELKFTIFREDGTELNYAEVSECYITLKFQNGTYLEPSACDVSSDSITYCLDKTSLAHNGTVTGLVKIYGENDQVATSNIFRFVIIGDMVDGCTLSNEDQISFVNDLLTKLANISFKEDIRDAQELSRVTAESARITNEEIRIVNENTRIIAEDARGISETTRISNEDARGINETARGTSETDRQSSESGRVTNETNRQSDFVTMQDEYVSLVAVIRDSLNQMIVFDIPSFSNPPDAEIHRILFSAPAGYKCTITEIKIISNGSAIGIDAINTSQIQLIEGSDIISDTTFNDVELFPSKNETKELVIIDGLIDKDDDVYIKVVNADGVTTPNFSLQVSYDIESIL